jgi:uncharacterized membrane protein
VGLSLFAFHFILLLPFLNYWEHAIPVIALAAIPTYFAFRYFKTAEESLVVGAQALDGAATFYIIDIFSPLSGIGYFEQHVFSRAVGELLDTFFLFYLLKVAIAFGAAYYVRKEKMGEQEKLYILMVFIIIGLAPGVRDILRMMAGT